MHPGPLARIASHPEFQTLVRERSRCILGLSVVMMAVYYAFILTIAFAPEMLGQPIGTGLTTWGIPIGAGIILFAFVLAGWYVHRANTRFDALNKALRHAFDEAKE